MRKRFVNRTASCVLALSITALNIITCPAAAYAKQSELSEISSMNSLDVVSPDEKNKTSKNDSILSEISEMNSLDEKDTNINQINELSDKDDSDINELSDAVEDTTEDISTEDVMNYFSRYGEDSEESEPVDVLMTESEFENFEDLLGDGAYFSVMAGSISFDVDEGPNDVKCGNIATNLLTVPSNDLDDAALYKFGTKGPLVIVESSERIKVDINKNRLYTVEDSNISAEEPHGEAISFVDTEKDTPEKGPARVRYFVSGDNSGENTGVVGAASDNLAKAYTAAKDGNSLNYLSAAKWNKNEQRFEIDCTKEDDGLFVFDMSPKSGGNYNASDDYYDPDYGYEDDDLQAAEQEKKLSYNDWKDGNLTIRINPNQYILFVDNKTTSGVEIGAINLEVNKPEGYEPPENMEYGYSQNLIWYFAAATSVSLAKPDDDNNKGSQFFGTFVAPNAAFKGRAKDNDVNDSFIRIMANSVSGNTAASLSTKAEEAMAPPTYEIAVSQKLDGSVLPAKDVDVEYGLENDISNFFYNNYIFCKIEVVQTEDVYEEGKPGKIIVEAPLESQPKIYKSYNGVRLTLGTDSNPYYYIKLSSKNYLMSGYVLDESEYVVKAKVKQQLTADIRSKYTYVQGYDVIETTYYSGASVADIAGGKAEDKKVSSIEFNHNTRKANEAQGNKYMPSSSDMVTAVLSDETSSNTSKNKTATKTPTPTKTPSKVTKTPTPASNSSSYSSYSSKSSSSNYDYDYDYSSKNDTKKKDQDKDKDKDKDKKKVTPTPTKVPAAIGIKGINSSLGDYADAIASGAKSDKQRRDNSPIKIYLDESKPGNRVVVSVNQMQELKEQKAKYEQRSVKAGNYGGAPYKGAGADIKQLVSKVSSAVVPETPLGAVLFWIIPIIILALLLIRARSKWQGAILSKSDNGIVVKRGIEGDENSLQQYINMSEGIGESLEELRNRLKKSHTSSYLPLNMKMKIVLITPARATTLAICGANEEKMYSILSEYEDRECKMKVIFFKNERENCAELEFTFGNRKWNKETIFETKPLVLDFNAI